MALTRKTYRRKGSNIVVHTLIDLDSTPVVLTVGNGKLRSIVARNDGSANYFVKLYNQKATVNPATANPDWKFKVRHATPAVIAHRWSIPDDLSDFTGGLQVGVSTASGPSAASPTGAHVTVEIEETA